MKKKFSISALLKGRSLQNYVLLEVLLLLLAVIGVLAFFSKKQSEKDFQTFAMGYVDNFNQRTINTIEGEVRKVSRVPAYAAKLLEKYLVRGAQDIPVSLSTPAHQFITKALKDTTQLTSLYVASRDGSFFQIRKVHEGDRFVLRESQNLPVITSYSMRVIDRTHGKPPVERFYYFDDDGNLVDSEVNLSPVYQPITRPWYLDAVDKKDMFIGSIYTFGLTPHLVMTSSVAILDKQEKVKGVIASDFNIKDLSTLLNKKRLTQNTRTYLLSKGDRSSVDVSSKNSKNVAPGDKIWTQDLLKLDMIASSEDSVPMNSYGNRARIVSMEERRGTLLWDALERFYEQKEEAFISELQGEDHLVSIMQVADSFGKEWLLVSLVPYSDLTSLLFSTQEDMISLYIFILFVSCLQVILLARRIAYPIEDLREEALKIKEFNLDGGVSVKSNIREVTALADTMKDMKVSLKSFTKYMPRQLVLNLLKSGSDINIGGESKKLTIFFSDIANFTTISEAMAPDDLMKHLSEYFEEITSILIREKGTIDKYIGDAIMAFWGAPNEDDNQVYNACRVALLAQHKLDELSKKWKLRGLPILETRMGIHTGNAIVGNVGCSDRMNYTIIGDSVNLASRLEGINKYYGTHVIVSEATYAEIKDEFLCRTLDIVAVKGKTKGVRIYELIAEFKDKQLQATREQSEFVPRFEKGFDFYLNLNFEKAKEVFESLKGLWKPYDELVDVYIQRCDDYIQTPPGDDWTGVYKLTKK